MDYDNYFKDMFESIPDYRKKVLNMFLFKNNNDLLKECGLLKIDNIPSNKDFKTILMEQNEDYLGYIKIE